MQNLNRFILEHSCFIKSTNIFPNSELHFMLSLKQRAPDIKEEHNVVKMEVIQNKKKTTKQPWFLINHDPLYQHFEYSIFFCRSPQNLQLIRCS